MKLLRKPPLLVTLGTLCVATGIAMTYTAVNLSAQVGEGEPQVSDPLPLDEPVLDDVLLPPEEPLQEPQIDSGQFIDPFTEMDPIIVEETANPEVQTTVVEEPADNMQQSSAPIMMMEKQETDLGDKTFYRGGKEVPVVAEPAKEETSSSSSSSSEAVMFEESSSSSTSETGALLPSAPVEPEPETLPPETDTPTDTSRSSIVSVIMSSTYVFVGIAVAIGAILYLLLGRKKKASVEAAPQNVPAPEETAVVEDSSPRLEQALKAMEKEGITPPQKPESNTPPIPQEGTEPPAA